MIRDWLGSSVTTYTACVCVGGRLKDYFLTYQKGKSLIHGRFTQTIYSFT